MGFPCCIYGDGVDKQRKGLVKPCDFISAKGKSRHCASGDGTAMDVIDSLKQSPSHAGFKSPPVYMKTKNKIVV